MKVSSLVPRRLKRGFKATVRRAALGGYPLSAVMNFLPYRPRADSFIVPTGTSSGSTTGLGEAVPPRHLWRGYGKTPEKYLASGAEHVKSMLQIVEDSGLTFSPGARVLDFGCAAGRMIRQLTHLAELGEVWGVDVSAESIHWCKRHLEPPFRFATTTTIPHLPFEDGYFDFIYAGSMFSHLEALAEAWLLELRRILSPGGRLYVTLNDERSIEMLEGSYWELPLAEAVRSDPGYRKSGGRFEMLVLRTGTTAHVFYGIDYFRQMAAKILDVNSVTLEAYGFQTAVLMTKAPVPERSLAMS